MQADFTTGVDTRNPTPFDGIDYVMTPSEKSKAAIYTVRALRQVKFQNERDAMHLKAAEAGDLARMGVVWGEK